jgi:hypothetical protein
MTSTIPTQAAVPGDASSAHRDIGHEDGPGIRLVEGKHCYIPVV